MADPTIPDARDNSGTQMLAEFIPTFVIAMIVYSIRIYHRLRSSYRLNAADYTITIAFFAEFICVICSIAAVTRGFGKAYTSLNDPAADVAYIGQTTMVVFVLGLWASCFARVSVALLLLQFTDKRAWKITLWSVITLQIAQLIACDIIQVTQCRPLKALWVDRTTLEHWVCHSEDVIKYASWISISLGAFSDLLFALLPMFLIWRLSRSKLEKLLVSILMCLGLLAAAANAFKIITTQTYNPFSTNIYAEIMPVYKWNRIEETLVVIGANMPLLKQPIETFLHRVIGLPRFHPNVRSLNTIQTDPPSNAVEEANRQYRVPYEKSQGSDDSGLTASTDREKQDSVTGMSAKSHNRVVVKEVC